MWGQGPDNPPPPSMCVSSRDHPPHASPISRFVTPSCRAPSTCSLTVPQLCGRQGSVAWVLPGTDQPPGGPLVPPDHFTITARKAPYDGASVVATVTVRSRPLRVLE